ncbi:MAG: hypothetical protein Q8T03_13420 [Bacteroidota bacterium]|nr:hypothetical protein [Bacteroidota bacterium]MDP3558366.1 hypothetical protein [Bacteroidota bacterium]
MKTNKSSQVLTQPRIFKYDLKFMDLWHITNDYLKTSSLDQEEKKEVMVRIHEFSLHLQNTIALYPLQNEIKDEQLYNSIASSLKELLRRAKISMARNSRFNDEFRGYWKFLAEVIKNEALLLQDEKLEDVFLNFETATTTF